ncbi:hypothetical protein [Raoultella ornithinolytica]|uniref:hypothetical protein n=1 Tax=Raoultella ornithinolytica TaxID=54291 RepID=UPI00247A7A4E|nr:hypothetical protein [Raoultella ornithinolytica]MDH7608686.1 hypothetical protein [Raoultella ornithinolytica]
MSIIDIGQAVTVSVNGIPGIVGEVIGYTVMKDTPVKYVITYSIDGEEVTDWFDESLVDAK